MEHVVVAGLDQDGRKSDNIFILPSSIGLSTQVARRIIRLKWKTCIIGGGRGGRGGRRGTCTKYIRRAMPVFSTTYIRRKRVSLRPRSSVADWLQPPRGSASEVKRAERVRGENKARLHNAVQILNFFPDKSKVSDEIYTCNLYRCWYREILDYINITGISDNLILLNRL